MESSSIDCQHICVGLEYMDAQDARRRGVLPFSRIDRGIVPKIKFQQGLKIQLSQCCIALCWRMTIASHDRRLKDRWSSVMQGCCFDCCIALCWRMTIASHDRRLKGRWSSVMQGCCFDCCIALCWRMTIASHDRRLKDRWSSVMQGCCFDVLKHCELGAMTCAARQRCGSRRIARVLSHTK